MEALDLLKDPKCVDFISLLRIVEQRLVNEIIEVRYKIDKEEARLALITQPEKSY